MSRHQAEQSVLHGFKLASELFSAGARLLGTGDMGIGNTTASSAITTVMTGRDVALVTGRGTGLSDEQLRTKVTVIKKAIELNRPDAGDGIDVLSKVGGFEIGGIAGVILAGASLGVPVVIDGFISGAAALIAASLCAQVKSYLIASHQSVEKGHRVLLKHLGLKPLFNLDLRLGEGTGAALGVSLAEVSLKILAGMATFAEAGVSEQG